jgi:hypothetical protein
MQRNGSGLNGQPGYPPAPAPLSAAARIWLPYFSRLMCFSDVQAQISADLIRNHYTVLATNQRSPRGIIEAILFIGRAIGCCTEAEKLASDFERQLRDLRCDEEPRPRRRIERTAHHWHRVSETIKLVGGDEPCFFDPTQRLLGSGKSKVRLFAVQILRSFSPVGVESP